MKAVTKQRGLTGGVPLLREGFHWGFVSQALSSVTTLGLSILAGRAAGPEGLGTAFIGFSTYLVLFGLQRALLTDPLIASSGARSDDQRRRDASLALTLILVASIASGALSLAGGLFLGGTLGRALVMISPWIAPALLQDCWRVVLFRDGRGGAAAMNSFAWLLGMAAAVPILLAWRTDWAAMATWGFGALTAALFGARQTRLRPSKSFRLAREWWLREGKPLGTWLSLESIVYWVASYGLVFILALLLGPVELGGLRSIQSIFAPLSLIIPAVSLPGLPAMVRSVAQSRSAARRLALAIGIGVTLFTALVVLVLSFAPFLVELLFGPAFHQYERLISPIGAGQVMAAGAVGFVLLLKAEMRGATLFWARTWVSLLSLGLISWLAVVGGTFGAAWGLAASGFASALLLGTLAFRREVKA
jgi:O-antigen/teichoic acid export membrane protein